MSVAALDWWVLDGHQPRRVTMDEWLACRPTSDERRVALTERDGWKVSTVFLTIDHGFGGGPILFETMVFGGDHDGEQWRYATWDEAQRGHDSVVAAILAEKS